MSKQIKMAVCPICHGTGCIGTTDWLIRSIGKKKLAKEREEALAEYEAKRKRGVAREIFAEIEQKRNEYWNKGKYTMFDCWRKAEEDVRKKYESEGENE